MDAATNYFGSATVDGRSRVQVGNNYKINHYHMSNPNCYVQALGLTDSSKDKQRIEDIKGKPLPQCCAWILHNESFKEWDNSTDSRLLWIEGDPGKGKTLLICGLIEQFSRYDPSQHICSYFFCEANQPSRNKPVAVLRGLIYLLLKQQECLKLYLENKFKDSTTTVFEELNVWYTLVEVFHDILAFPGLGKVLLMIDALDECESDLDLLLNLISHTTTDFSKVRWVISSRRRSIPDGLLRGLKSNMILLSLEEASDAVSDAVCEYIRFKVDEIGTQKGYDSDLRDEIETYLTQHADGTFLWVSLVFRELYCLKSRKLKALEKLRQFPSGLTPLCERLMKTVEDSDDSYLCRRVLAILCITYRPIALEELPSLDAELHKVDKEYGSLQEVVELCASFVTMREGTLYLIHQSVKEFLTKDVSSLLFPHGQLYEHHTIFLRSCKNVEQNVRRNMYDVLDASVHVNNIKAPEPHPLKSIRYCCVYLIEHFIQGSFDNTGHLDKNDGSQLISFLREKFVYWLEAMALFGHISFAIHSIAKLRPLLFAQKDQLNEVAALVQDAFRFLRFHASTITSYPLQLYTSCVTFSPSGTLENLFRQDEDVVLPQWIELRPNVGEDWGPCLQTIDTKSWNVRVLAVSADGTQLATVPQYNPKTVHHIDVWEAPTGCHARNLVQDDSESEIYAAAFSPSDRTRLAILAKDRTIKLWDVATKRSLWRSIDCGPESPDQLVSFTFTLEGIAVVSCSGSHINLHLFAPTTGSTIQKKCFTTQGIVNPNLTVLSENGHTLVSLTPGSAFHFREIMSGRVTKLVPCGFKVDDAKLLTISTDSKLIAVSHMTVKTIMNMRTDSVVYKMFGPTPTQMHLNCVTVWCAETSRTLSQFYKDSGTYKFKCIKFSPNGKFIAGTYMYVGIVDIWDVASGKLLQTIGSHDFQTDLTSFLFSPASPEIVCAQSDGIFRIWEIKHPQTAGDSNLLKGSIQSIKISPDLKIIASTSPVQRRDAVLELWDASNGQFLRQSSVSEVLELEVCFSADSKRVASWGASADWHSFIVIWDCQTLTKLRCLHFTVGLIGFDENLTLVTTCDHKSIMRVFNFDKGEYTHIIPFTKEFIRGAMSPDGKYLATVSKHTIIRVWDLTSPGKVRLVRSIQLSHHQLLDLKMEFSTDCSLIAVSSHTMRNITICDITNGQVSESVNCSVSDSLCCSAAGPQLHTDTGTLDIEFVSSGAPDNVPQLSSTPRISRNGYGLSDCREWIMLGSQKVMYIPPDYQTRISAVLGSTVVLGCRNGKVLIMRLSKSKNALEQRRDSNGSCFDPLSDTLSGTAAAAMA